MDTSAISSLTTLYPTQKASGIIAPVISNSNGDKDGSRVSGTGGGHHHHGGGAFMQDVMQSLQSLGLNVSGNNASSTTPTSSTTPSVSATSNNIGQTLHTFMHDLHQALRQSGSTQQPSSTTDGDGDNSSVSSSAQNGYSNFASNLQSLIGSLNNTSGTPASNSTDATLQTDFSNLVSSMGGSTSSTSPTLQNFLSNLETNVAGASGATGTTGNNASKLQTDFANLLSAIGGGSSSSSTPTLQDFLNKMVSNASNSSTTQNGLGSIISAQA
jgi:hypothetical protein